MVTDAAKAQIPECVKETEVNAILQEKVRHSEDILVDKHKKLEKRGKNKSTDKRRQAEKQKKASIVHTKVDLPPHMVRAHRAAYDYLNPNISRYDTLMGLLDQAAQTKMSLQPMMKALVMHFEEVNLALEEMAEEGELMLKEHGDYMAWPSGMTGSSDMSNKPTMDTDTSSDPPPDLLHQLLQHSLEKMRLVGNSVQGLGDSTLEEVVEYFASLSRLLGERLHTKQAAEQRLALVLGRVEVAAIKRSNPEDSALHSEDSGIGGENESLTGCERHRRSRGSAGSGSSGSMGNGDGALVTNGNNNNNSWPDSKDDLDVDSLPPPPPEVLMDNSFQSTEMTPGNAEEDPDKSCLEINQRSAVSQRLRASVQNVTVLPNRISVRQRSTGISPPHPVRQDAVMGTQTGQVDLQPETELDQERKKTTTVYQQARKIIHLHNATEFLVKKSQAHRGDFRETSSLQAGAAQLQGGADPYDADVMPSSLPVIAPPVSRVRLPPSCPVVHHRFPSPPAFTVQPTLGSSRPSSRPGSPRALTWAREGNTEEFIPSVSFSHARSVFSQNETWTPSSSSVLPRPWGEPSRGRLPTRGAETSSRRTQSEQRPSSTSQPEVPHDGGKIPSQAKASRPATSSNTERLASPLMTEEDAQSDPSAVTSSA
ncbi:photoreceptor cilium actin regulator [Lampris incognitus]|uniref:photoreceptor cilium actin regulator n=1 Tax=Lampris incognitus TaxID=2546036 RepID=UPI0024B55E86|nr:photoreceptor cilium actin regulator [Lampris incognitus]